MSSNLIGPTNFPNLVSRLFIFANFVANFNWTEICKYGSKMKFFIFATFTTVLVVLSVIVIISEIKHVHVVGIIHFV